MEIVADCSIKKLTDGCLTREGSLIAAEGCSTESREDVTSDAELEREPAERGKQTERQRKTKRPRRDDGRRPTGRVIGERRAERGDILAKDGCRGGWSEVMRKRVEGMSKTDGIARSDKDVGGDLER